MIKVKYNTKLISMITFILVVALITSCEKDNDKVNDGKVQLLSFGPTGAKHGDTLSFIGNNLQKVTAIQFTGEGTAATIEQKDFKQQTSELILLLVPAAAEKGFVTLKTPDGDIVSITKLDLDVTTLVSAVTDQARPGENITITGNYVNWVTKVTFAKDKVVETFVSKSLDKLVVTVPADAQTGPLILTYSGTDAAELQTDDTLKVVLPVATGFSPNPVKHKTDLAITGTDLDLVKKILFPGVSTPVTSFVSQSNTQLVVKVPSETTKGKVTLYAASDVSTVSQVDMDVALPSVTSMTPDPADIGANLTINGTNLDIVTSISFQGASTPVTSFVSQSANQIVVQVPTGSINGKLVFGVLNSTLTALSPNLTINGYIPPSGPAFPFYDEKVTSNWNGWIGGGWGGTKDFANQNPVRTGSYSCKIDYSGGWGSPVQLGGGNINLTLYSSFKISIYGGAGSNGLKVNIGINQSDSYTITLVEGKWTDYTIPISTLTAATTLNEIWIKEYNGSGGFTIYVDEMGLN
ncbi:MAG: IPT/TIG domain-containing protein [Chitinophagaceae bacterium]